MNRIKTDILVIGAGSGGLSVAAGASQMGADVVLLEGHKMGGDCLNYGCVPSKALIASGKAAYGQAHTSAYGVADVVPKADYAAAKDHVADVISQIEPTDSQERFEGFGVDMQRRMRQGFLDLAAKFPERIVVVDGARPIDDVQSSIRTIVQDHLK